jgi:hypothetical protein
VGSFVPCDEDDGPSGGVAGELDESPDPFLEPVVAGANGALSPIARGVHVVALVRSDERVCRQRVVGHVGGERVSVDVPATAVLADAEPGDAGVVPGFVGIRRASLAGVRHGRVV